MKKLLALTLSSTLFIAGCASNADSDKMPMAGDGMATTTIAQAEKDLNAAIEAGAQWRLIDKSTGGKAVDMSKLLSVAKKKAEEGDMKEANRIAMRVSDMSKVSLDQSKRYAGATPYYQ